MSDQGFVSDHDLQDIFKASHQSNATVVLDRKTRRHARDQVKTIFNKLITLATKSLNPMIIYISSSPLSHSCSDGGGAVFFVFYVQRHSHCHACGYDGGAVPWWPSDEQLNEIIECEPLADIVKCKGT